MVEEVQKRAKKYQDLANEKWNDIINDFYVCYTNCDLASKVIYDLFERDIFNDAFTYYRNIESGIKVLCELEEYIYFTFDIIWTTGMFGDTGQHVSNGSLRLLKKIPKGYKDIEQLFDMELDEEGEE